MAEIPPFVKFNRKKISWESYKHADLGKHINYCESHIEICEQTIAQLNGNLTSFFVLISIHFLINDSFYYQKRELGPLKVQKRERQLKPESKLVSNESFPPAQVFLHQHFLRAQYQAFQWCHASQGRLNLPSPSEYGFKEENTKLTVNWFDGDMLPPSLHTRVS